MVGTFYYNSKDQYGKDIKEVIGDISLSIVEGAENRLENAQKIDALGRAIAGLTTNTYMNGKVDYSYDVQDVIDEEG